MEEKKDSKKLTNEVGAPVSDNEHVLTAGPRGPMMMQDLWFFEKMGHFNREVIPERRMHAKGSGAFGSFTTTHDVSKYTKAKVFENGKKTDVFVRFSTVAGERGAADAERDIRGFAVKFYTDEGNWDLVGNNTPVFFLRDPLKFPDLNHAVKRDPRTNMRSPQNNWNFWSLLPEAFHQVTVVMSDRGIPASYRHMHGFGSHTFSLYNEKNERVWVKFHFKTQQGIKNLTNEEAADLVAKDRESHQRDLYEAIERGDFPRWTMYFQIMTEEQASARDIDPFDVTTVWSHKEYPLIEVGVLELDRNPDNYYAQVEQAAFSPAHIVPGIGLSPDKLLQGRLFSYADAQRYRLGVNSDQIPVNRSKAPAHAYHRDGLMRVDGNYGSTKSYHPNSFGEWEDQNKYREPADKANGDIYHYDPKDYPTDNCFKQGGDLWRLIPEDEKAVLVKNTAADMATVTKNVKYRHATHCYLADPEYGERISRALDLDFETVKKYSKLDHEGLAKVTK